ncbi:MAG: cbb3-type cytochrome c oxidase subunit I [Vicinamibacterales bacterium]
MDTTTDTISWTAADARSWRRMTLVWGLTVLVLLPVLVALGSFMRMFQANLFPAVAPDWFYAVLTLHSLGMVGAWFVGTMAGISYLLSKYTRPSLAVARFAYVGTILGVVLLIACTLVGRFGAGWYFLFPLPLYAQGVWSPWATWTFFAALATLGVCWMIWTLDLLRAIARRYSLGTALCLHYLAGRTSPEVPPMILISTVSLIANLAGFLAAVIVIVLFGVQALGVDVDPLLMKNLTFFFGHLLVNVTMYLGVAMVYELLPTYAGRPWKTSRVVATAWGALLFLIFFAYFHHLYMDFAQPRWVQTFGQISSYLLSVPAAVVSIFGTLALVYASKMRWRLASMLFFLGIMGWGVGGIAAVIDSTVEFNVRFHNTLWVPAHFHTYYLMGVVLIVLGFIDHFSQDLSRAGEIASRTKWTVLLLVVGGYGFLAMFYWGGAHSVPRRFAVYPEEVAQGVLHARIALGFIAVLFVGILLYLWETGKRCIKGVAS